MKTIKYIMTVLLFLNISVAFAEESCNCKDCERNLKVYIGILCSLVDCKELTIGTGFDHYPSENTFFSRNEKVIITPLKAKEIIADPSKIMTLEFKKIDNREFKRLEEKQLHKQNLDTVNIRNRPPTRVIDSNFQHDMLIPHKLQIERK